MADQNIHNLLKSALGATPRCPPVEQLAGPLDETVRAHLDSCAHCQNERALLAEFTSAQPRAAEAADVDWVVARLREDRREPDPEPSEPWWRRWFAPVMLTRAAFAMAALLIAFVGVRTLMEHRPGAPAGLDREPMRAQPSVELLGASGELAVPPDRLAWRPFPGAASYALRLMEVDQTELWKVEVATTQVPVPEVVARQIVPHKTLLWQITAIDSAGKPLALSESRKFVVKTSPVR